MKKNRFTGLDMIHLPLLNKHRIAEDIGNLLVLAPHPDDETLGCGGLIAMLRNSGIEVSIIFVTSGSASHPNSKTHPPHELSLIREKEAIKACKILNVELKNVYFLGCQDSKLNALSIEEMDEQAFIISELIELKNFNSIALPWRKDPHPDHIVTTVIGNVLIEKFKRSLIKLEYPIWLWENGRVEDWPLKCEVTAFRLDISDFKIQKKTAMGQHQSQLGKIIKDDPYGFVMTEDLLEPFYGAYEYFFVENNQKTETLNHEYFAELYEKQNDPWNFRNSEYENEKYHYSIKALDNKNYKFGLELGCSVGVQTKLLSEICENLVAVDISEIAIQEAEVTCENCTNVEFFVQDVSKNFPKGKFDLITLCEIGYYFNKTNLLDVFKNIDLSINSGGNLLLVHWTGFVPDYPLTGDEVHLTFEEYNDGFKSFKNVVSEAFEFYRMDIWRKI